MSRRLQGRIARAFALGLVAIAIAIAARGLERHTTWYLASDQFAFLTFGRDLAQGRVFHPSDVQRLLSPRAQPEQRTYDALYQTYLWSGDRLYSRYPPGFPAMLALAWRMGGEVGEHALNPVLYLALIGLVAGVTWAALRAHDRSLAAATAVVAVWLLLLLPTQVHLWGITVARDLPAHLLGLAAVAAALLDARAAAGFLLGLACTVRPDALLYAASLAAIFAVTRAPLRAVVRSGAAFAVGALPLFAYNWAARGHPLAFTQGGEFDQLLSAWRAAERLVVALTAPLPSGGGFRLRHLPTSFPGNFATLVRAFGWTGLLALAGVAWSWRVRPVVAAAFAPYPLVALPFYSFWSHPDPRYLAGVCLCAMPLAALGAVVVCRRVASPATPLPERLVLPAAAAVLAWLAAAGVGRAGGGSSAAPEIAIAGALAVAALASLVSEAGRAPAERSRLVVLLPGLALALAGLARVVTSQGGRDPFQRDQVERARRAIEAAVPAGALVVAGETLGRPAENITHYTHARAHYPSELSRLGVDSAVAAVQVIFAGRRAFLLFAADDAAMPRELEPFAQLRIVERRRGRELYDWFVNPAAAPRGVVLAEVEIPAESLEALRAFERQRREGPGASPG